MSKYKLVSYEKKGSDYIITLEISRLFRKPIIQKYRGNCTVWFSYPEAKRCSTYMECELLDFWRRVTWEEES